MPRVRRVTVRLKARHDHDDILTAHRELRDDRYRASRPLHVSPRPLVTPGEAAAVREWLQTELQHDRAAYQHAGPEVAERHDATIEALACGIIALAASQEAANAR